MDKHKSTFALFFGTRDVFPDSLIAAARRESAAALEKLGYRVLMLDENATKAGAVQSPQEGAKYAAFLAAKKGKYDGVIIILPNFGDENGAVVAMQDVDVPVLILAYPDELNKMGPAVRRDGFCGKFSIMDVFCQYGIKFTALKPHTVAVGSKAFVENIDYFDRVCRVVKGVRRMKVGSVGARVTPFKTVRIDELALQKHNITVETYDLSYVFDKMRKVSADKIKAKMAVYENAVNLCKTPAESKENLARMGVALDDLISEEGLDAIAIRCWFEVQQQFHISPCMILGEMNNRFVEAACEVDLGNAIVMRALRFATGQPSACLDWNNNYGDDENKCILFHCGPVPMDLMTEKGTVTDHSMIATVVGENKSFGPNVGRIKPMDFTFGSLLTRDGRVCCYVGEGAITKDPIAADFFGCAGVAQIDRLQDVLLHVGTMGHRHHVSISPGRVADPMREAMTHYLGFEVTMPQCS
jgi:L-fucose isomerase-like protein